MFDLIMGITLTVLSIPMFIMDIYFMAISDLVLGIGMICEYMAKR